MIFLNPSGLHDCSLDAFADKSDFGNKAATVAEYFYHNLSICWLYKPNLKKLVNSCRGVKVAFTSGIDTLNPLVGNSV